MQIIKGGNKELIGKIYFRCNNCKCEFIADEGEYDTFGCTSPNVGCTSPNVAGIDCPCCGVQIESNSITSVSLNAFEFNGEYLLDHNNIVIEIDQGR